MPYLILPFEKDTLSFLDKMIERMEKQPVWKERPIRVLPLGKEVLWLFPWKLEKRHDYSHGLRTFLPGIETHGSARFLETLCFAFRMLPESNYPSQCLSGERLRLATRSMKAWIWSAESRNEFACKFLRGEILDCIFRIRNTGPVYYEDFRLQNDFYNDVSKKYLWLPRLKLRKYALEHGTLPEKLSDALSQEEITHKVGNRVFRLEYSIHPEYEKFYPRGSVVSRDYKGTRRHPFLYLVERKSFYNSISRIELDEPEEKLPEKGVLK